jgi:hypothetical protein
LKLYLAMCYQFCCYIYAVLQIAMNNLLFDTTGLSAIDTDAFDATCRDLKTKFRVEVPGYIDFGLDQFQLLKHYKTVNTRHAFALKNMLGDNYMLFLEVEAPLKPLKGKIITHKTEYQPWGLAYLKHDFGRVLIRPETLVDKVAEIFHPIELDFREDKPFSDRFYVLTDDRHKATTGMDQNFRDAVMAIKENDIVIEIIEHTLIIGNRKPVKPQHACYLAEFVAKLAGRC